MYNSPSSSFNPYPSQPRFDASQSYYPSPVQQKMTPISSSHVSSQSQPRRQRPQQLSCFPSSSQPRQQRGNTLDPPPESLILAKSHSQPFSSFCSNLIPA